MGYPTDKNGESCSAFHTGRDENVVEHAHEHRAVIPAVPAMKKTDIYPMTAEWSRIEMWQSLTLAISEAHGAISLNELRSMSVETLINRLAPNGIRFSYHPTKAVKG